MKLQEALDTILHTGGYAIQGKQGCNTEYYCQYTYVNGTLCWTAGGTCGGKLSKDGLARALAYDREWRVQSTLHG